MYFTPKPLIRVAEIFFAAPLDSSIFPSMAPRQRISARPDNVLPTPVSMDLITSIGFIPRNNPVRIATRSSEINGLTFLTDRKICKEIARAIIIKVIRFSSFRLRIEDYNY